MDVKLPNYKDDPQFYKDTIEKINGSIDFPRLLLNKGYKMVDRSAGSMEFRSESDKIVLNLKRDPITYFNRNDTKDTGTVFNFLAKDTSTFYETVKLGLRMSNQEYLVDNDLVVMPYVKKEKKSLENNYNIKDFTNGKYLVQSRSLAPETLVSPPFRGRIFNAYHKVAAGGSMANIAFPKYDIDGHIKNYVLRNKPFMSKKTQKLEKFRRVLNENDQYLFYSNIPKGNQISKILVSESEIDILSHYEIKPDDNALYVSFGGNVYQKKIDQLILLVQKHESVFIDKNINFVSITDNDAAGFQYDIALAAAFTNYFEKNVIAEFSLVRGTLEYKVHFQNDDQDALVRFSSLKNLSLENEVSVIQGKSWISVSYNYANEVGANKYALRLTDTTSKVFQTLTFPIRGIDISQDKTLNGDWNEQLIRNKQYENFSIHKVLVPGDIRKGRYIEFKRDTDSKLTKGIVIEKEPNSVKVKTQGGAQISIPLENVSKYGIKLDNNYRFRDGEHVTSESDLNNKESNEIEL